MSESDSEVRNLRTTHWFWMDRRVVTEMLQEMSDTSFAVYSILCCHSFNETQTCKLKLSTICTELGKSKSTVIRALKELDQLKLIKIVERWSEDGRQLANGYDLLDYPGGCHQCNPQGVTHETPGVSPMKPLEQDISKQDSLEEDKNAHTREDQDFALADKSAPAGADAPESTEPPNVPAPPLLETDDVVTRCVKTLEQVPRFPKDRNKTMPQVAQLVDEFPDVNPEQVCRDYVAWHTDHSRKTKNFLTRLRGFFKNAERWAGERESQKPKADVPRYMRKRKGDE